MSKTEDDFWNTSSSSAFCFDDDEELGQVADDFYFTSISEESSLLPIHTLISKNSLDLILYDSSTRNDVLREPVEETIHKMIHGLKFNINVHRRFNEKTALLDKALESYNGNVILNVILYLKRTLKNNIFYAQLAKRKSGIKQYAYYLIVNNNFNELADFYMATGNSHLMKNIYYYMGQGVQNRDLLFKKREQFIMDHLQKVNFTNDDADISRNVKFSKWKDSHKSCAKSVVEELANLCKNEFKSQKNISEKIIEFKKEFKIDELAFEWTVMNVLSCMQLWTHLQDIFIKNNWLTKKNVLKTCLSSEAFINGLGRHKPPTNVIQQYLIYVSDPEKALNLGLKFQCHNFVINCYIQQKDRLALINYKSKVPSQSQEFFLIESALQSSDKKWKN